MSRPYSPNTIQQDIHPNIRLAGNLPAGYSAGTILLPITQKIRHYGKNESYLTQWHTRGFQNIKLISLYSKSVSRENSKCLHVASVQMKHIVQNNPFFSHYKQNDKMSHLTQWHTKGFQNIKLVSLYSKSVSRENSKCLHFASVQVKHIVQNRPYFSHSKQNDSLWTEPLGAIFMCVTSKKRGL